MLGKMPSLLASLEPKGFLTLGFQFDPALAEKLFSEFDEICRMVDLEYDERIAVIDAAISEYVDRSDDPLANDCLLFKNLKSEFNNLEMASYQYLEGLFGHLEACLRGQPARSEILRFLKAMEISNNDLKARTREIIQLVESRTSCRIKTMFKVWKYLPVKGEKYLAPLHFDRSVFSSVVYTRNPGGECLRLAPPGLGSTIEEVRGKVRNENLIIPAARDFPLLIPGLCARKLFGLEPTPHAVLNLEPEIGAKARYSLVFFIMPRERVNAAHNHISDEQELLHQQSGKTFQFRRALPCDGPGLAKVQVHSWQAAYRGRIADTYLQGLSVEQKVRDWEKVFQTDGSFTLLAQEKDDQAIVGFITLGSYRDGDGPQDGFLELRALYIDPDHWRKGLGKKLTRLAMEECRRRKVGRLVLWVLESNSEAQKFYQELGFQGDGEVKVDDRIKDCPLVEWRYSRSL